MYPAGN